MAFRIYTFFLVLTTLLLAPAAMVFAQENLALSAAEVSTSHVSPWEDLYAINNNIDPASSTDKAGGAYGNWTGTDEQWQWVEYGWDQLQYIDSCDVYWWTDGGGIQIPYDCYLEYWDFQADAWLRIPDATGKGVERDRYNRTTFPRILSSRIRLHMVSTIATGILEWKVWGTSGEQVPVGSVHEIDRELQKGSESEIVIMARDQAQAALPGYSFKLNILIDNAHSANQEVYTIDGIDHSVSAYAYELEPTSASGEVSFRIALPAEIDPRDGLRVQVLFNDAITTLGVSYDFHEPGLQPPLLSPDESQNTVDKVLELTFEDDASWRSAVQQVYAGQEELSEPVDYEISEGIIRLKPAGGHPALSTAGDRRILVQALAYEDVSVMQQVLAGAVDTAHTLVGTKAELYQPARTAIEIRARDQYGNPVPGVRFNYDAGVLNEDATTLEVYELAGMELSNDLSDQESEPADEDGLVQIPIAIPRTVDRDDGIVISFSTEEGIPLGKDLRYINDGQQKEILLQNGVRTNAGFSWDRTAQSENFILYWGEKIQGEPEDQSNGDLAFEPMKILQIMEDLLTWFNDSIGFIENPDSLNMGRYKHEIVMNETWGNGFTGWAFGGMADGKIGGMWIHPRATGGPAVLAHEFAHMNQAMVFLQYPGYGLNMPYAGFFWESHAQFMMKTYTGSYAGVNPERYVFTSMMQYSTTRRHYQNVYFIDHIRDRYGMQTVNDIWRKADPKHSHPLTSLRDSVLRYSQDELNDEFAAHAMKNVTWDYSGGAQIRSALSSVNPIHLQRNYTILDTIAGSKGHYIVPEYLAPGDYGYNIIPLFPDEGSSSISVDFRGLENEPAGGAGWRYAFVAVDRQGVPRYGDIHSDPAASAAFSLQPGDSAVFLVVTAAPDTHHDYPWEPGYAKVFRYPYSLEFTGALPAGYKAGYNSEQELYPGAVHPNGGGWVASTAAVDQSAYVGPNAQVLGEARVLNDARVEDHAIVRDNAIVRGRAIVRDQAIVGGASVIEDQAIVEKSGRVFSSSVVKDQAVLSGSALLYRSTLSGQAVARDLARLSGCTVSGTAIIGGDAEEYSNVSAGTYLDISRTSALDGRVDHPKNTDVNPRWPEYSYPLGEKPEAPLNLSAEDISGSSVKLTWDRAGDFREVESYYLYRDGQFSEIVHGTSLQVNDLSPSSSYSFALKAVDRSGNVSDFSGPLEVSTPVSDKSGVSGSFSALVLYPNPVEEYLILEAIVPGKVLYTIRNLAGQTICRGSFSGSCRLDRAAIGPPGVYLLSAESEGKLFSTKFTVL